ncbi:MAG: transcription antitermination factor NusB [Planctomycetota bacterium]
MRKRTRARELSLQFLYQVDLCGEETLKQINEFLQNESKDEDVVRFATRLIQGAWEKRNDIDEMIRKIARNWDLNRMAAIDRNILRLAIYEMQGDDAPPKVIINEAIDLGKKFSTQQSGKFINGILDRAKAVLASGGAGVAIEAPPAELAGEMTTESAE